MTQNEQQQGANYGDDRARLSKKTNSTESTQKASEAPRVCHDPVQTPGIFCVGLSVVLSGSGPGQLMLEHVMESMLVEREK